MRETAVDGVIGGAAGGCHRPERRTLRPILCSTLVLLAGGSICPPARGATATVIETRIPLEGVAAEDGSIVDTQIVKVPALIAAPGEANRVRIMPGPTDTAVLVEDVAAVVTVGAGCVADDAHRARCENVARERVLVETGDLNDVVVASAGIAVDARGGPGNDRLTGADRSDHLFGGGGAWDVLAGLGADDVLGDGDGVAGAAVDGDVIAGGGGNDTVSYATRVEAVHVDLSETIIDRRTGEGDELTSIENVHGGAGADRLAGSGAANVLRGGAGSDLIDAGAGPDTVDGGSGADRVGSGAGADIVAGGTGNDRIALGAGDDIIDDERQRRPTGRDDITCGAGRDHIKALPDPHADRLARSCELFTATERRIDDHRVAGRNAVTVPLGRVRRSGRNVLVAVTCGRATRSPACVITGALRGPRGGSTLAMSPARVTVKPGRRAVLLLRLTARGRTRVRRGKRVRLLLREHSPETAAILLHERARAQAQVVIR